MLDAALLRPGDRFVSGNPNNGSAMFGDGTGMFGDGIGIFIGSSMFCNGAPTFSSCPSTICCGPATF